jgi:predicted kinase
MRTIIITRGLPASGKSSWAREQLTLEPERWIRLNKDDLRSQLFDARVLTSAEQKLVVDLQHAMLRQALRAGRDVIVDNTNLSSASIRGIHDIACEVGDVTVIERVFAVDLEECIARDAIRTPRVGETVIRDMSRRYGLKKCMPQSREVVYEPVPELRLTSQDESLPEVVIVDLDGTAALIGDRSPYDASRCDELDSPNLAVVETVLALRARRGCSIVFVSGRDEQFRVPTVRFIEKHFRIVNDDFARDPMETSSTKPMPYELHMRPAGDVRRDTTIKREIYDGRIAGRYRVLVVIDDRPCVVRMWRHDLGLMTFALNDKEF